MPPLLRRREMDRNLFIKAQVDYLEAADAIQDATLSATIKPYKIYTALLTQASTGIPTVKILENTLGGVPVYSYTSTGIYVMTLTGAFPADKTFISKPNQSDVASAANTFTLVHTSANAITINTFSGNYATASNAILVDTPIEIKVYE